MSAYEIARRMMVETNTEFRVQCAGTGLELDGIPSDELIEAYGRSDDAVPAYLAADGYWCPLLPDTYLKPGWAIARVFLY